MDPRGRFLDCNAAARSLLELPAEGPVGSNLNELLVAPADLAGLAAAALVAEEEGKGFPAKRLRMICNGREIAVDHYLEAQRESPGGKVVAFIGCLTTAEGASKVDSHSSDLQRKVEELTFDIGRILHANTSTLIMVNQTLSAAASALRDAPSGEHADESIEEQVARLASALADALEQLGEAGEQERREKALPPEQWETLASQVRILRDYERLVPVEEIRNVTLRSSAAGITRLCGEIQPRWLPREPVRKVQSLARRLERLTCSRDVSTTRTAVVQMDFTLRALRDFVTSEVRTHERPRRLSVNGLLQEAIKQLADFAQASNVEIVWRDRDPNLEVMGNERELVRAFSNVLHNAIKYSWQRDRSKPPWVAIRTPEEDGSVSIEFDSWGVPITDKELQEELVYKMGYRGKWSTDRGRLGTGIGLTDTRRVIESNSGHMTIESRPAQPTSLKPDDREYYQLPFLTRVSLRLPVAE